jgi:hypothetical protein
MHYVDVSSQIPTTAHLSPVKELTEIIQVYITSVMKWLLRLGVLWRCVEVKAPRIMDFNTVEK